MSWELDVLMSAKWYKWELLFLDAAEEKQSIQTIQEASGGQTWVPPAETWRPASSSTRAHSAVCDSHTCTWSTQYTCTHTQYYLDSRASQLNTQIHIHWILKSNLKITNKQINKFIFEIIN